MHPEHAALMEQLRAAARPRGPGFDPQAYLGGEGPVLNVPSAERRRIARAWAAAHRTASAGEVLAVVDSLFAGEGFDDRTTGALVLDYHAPARRAVGPAEVDRWLGRLQGWAQVDSLCQSLFGPDHLLADWPAWRGLIRGLARDPNINKRRAALVLLTKPVHKSPDPRLSELAFETIGTLSHERPILITKAVSWLLRSLATHHGQAVAAYLDAHADALPRIAIRETRTKLRTGVKTPR